MTNNSDTQARFLTTDQLLQRWAIHRTTLHRLRKAGLPTIKLGKMVRFDAEAVDAWILEYAESTAADAS